MKLRWLPRTPLRNVTETPWSTGATAALHKARLKLDEEGTEAAAATAFVVSNTSVPPPPPPPIPVIFDHPFVFFIRDVPTGSLLFVGHFANP